jgi:hypothetical protein
MSSTTSFGKSRSSSGARAFIWLLLTLCSALYFSAARAAEIYGDMYLPNGHPAANAEIMGAKTKQRKIVSDFRKLGATDASGVYSLQLPPGSYLFSVSRYTAFVSVAPNARRNDIELH